MFTSNVDDEEIQKFYKEVSNTVKALRIENKMSQLELALTIGQRGNAFFNYAENNTKNKHFNLEHLYKISKALGISLSQFFELVEKQNNS
ncbi:transcriptional regulator [Halarcobacter ebronensis]|uniref:Transcriptional regulator n=1 Tax=Halarcobacter ebronensis TaxID=1462615 RepID=A0A4Q1ARH6_9BACT|nr:helix-turn-helix transcriptional regulator [Halarcobacter ebronensis]QKF80616.1 transcriptional regulator, XRE family [Halarcobacter ebronensis]RXJ68559.1 transcriptional regulator [Halarcobacter ebronensis]RXK08417.1 transcriptional regulator [Halarcobacter ebronensis]